MKNWLGYKFWLYYCAILATLLIVGGFYITNSSKNLSIANWLFVPVVIFFWLAFAKFRKSGEKPKTGFNESKLGFFLLLYSLLLTTIITLGGFAVSRSNQELISNAIFLPLTVFCWYLYYKRPKSAKGLVGKTTDAILKGMVSVAQKRGLNNSQKNSPPFVSEEMQNKNWEINELSAKQQASQLNKN